MLGTLNASALMLVRKTSIFTANLQYPFLLQTSMNAQKT